MISIIQKEIDIFKGHVWSSHGIQAQKVTQLPNVVPNHIYDFPEKDGLQNKGKIIFWSK